MNLAIVAGGWHFPAHFYRVASSLFDGADLFCVAHRNPGLAIVREEKRDALEKAPGRLGELDREMYAEYPTVKELRGLGWEYQEEPNTCGDWEFFNQWLATHDYRDYDLILNCHDDTYVRGPMPVEAIEILCDELLTGNGYYPEAPLGYVRGSCEFWLCELLEMLGGKIPLGEVALSRVGKTDTPTSMEELAPWNSTTSPLLEFMRKRGLLNRVGYLSPYYRISPFFIEGERGFLHWRHGAPWSFEKGLEAYPV